MLQLFSIKKSPSKVGYFKRIELSISNKKKEFSRLSETPFIILLGSRHGSTCSQGREDSNSSTLSWTSLQALRRIANRSRSGSERNILGSEVVNVVGGQGSIEDFRNVSKKI